MFLVAACGRAPEPAIVATPTPTPLPSFTPTVTPTPTPVFTPTPSRTPAGWQEVAEGAYIRRMFGTEGERGGYVYALRLDPARVDVRLRYDPDRPRNVAGWFDDEQALAVLNAGFFADDFTPVGLWVIDDAEYGRGHHLMQAELRVSGAGVSILRVSERYKRDGTRTIASVESYPLLIHARRVVVRSRDENRVAERTVVGIDGAGHLVFVLAPSATFSLPGLAEWLARSDLNLDFALNLDGGSSSGMLVRAGGEVWGRDSGRDVPGALIVLPKVLGVEGGVSP